MKISVSDVRWISYCSEPNPESYKGFKLIGEIKIESNIVKLAFTNGEKEFEVAGGTIEYAFIKGFDLIDSF